MLVAYVGIVKAVPANKFFIIVALEMKHNIWIPYASFSFFNCAS